MIEQRLQVIDLGLVFYFFSVQHSCLGLTFRMGTW